MVTATGQLLFSICSCPILNGYHPKSDSVQGCRGLCVTFASYLRELICFSKMETVGRTSGDAGRRETLIQSIHAVVAFHSLARLWIPLRCPPRAGGYARLATYAKPGVYEDDSVFGPLLHGACGACCHTPWVLTVVTGHEGVGRPGEVSNKFWTHRNDLTDLRADGKSFVALASHFAAPTVDAFLDVLKQVVFAHELPPLGCSFCWLHRS